MIWLLLVLVLLVTIIGLFIDWSNRVARKASIDNRADKLIPTNLEPERAKTAPIKRVQADSLASSSPAIKQDAASKDYDDFFDVDDDFFTQYDDDPFDKK